MLLTFAKKQLATASTIDQTSALPTGSLTGQPALYTQPRYGEVDGIPVYVQGEGNMVGFSPVSLCTEIATGETAWIKTETVHGRRLEPFAPIGTARARTTPKAAKPAAPAK
jgi:hypothetical protein